MYVFEASEAWQRITGCQAQEALAAIRYCQLLLYAVVGVAAVRSVAKIELAT
jgi:hypothetical protein